MHRKVIFSISFILNIILISIVFSMYSKLSISKEVASNEILHQLINLETIIGEQMHLDWSNPELVSRKLDNSLMTMYRSFNLINESSFIFGKNNSEVIHSVFGKLESYKKSKVNEIGEFKPEDKADFETLNAILREVGIGQGITITVNDFDDFIVKMEALNNEL